MGKLINNYIYNFMYQIVVLLVPLILSPFLARNLGADNLGIYSYVYSTCSVISTVSLIGTYNYGARQIAYVRDNPTEQRNVYWEIFWLRFIFGILGILVYFTVGFKSEYSLYFILFSGWLVAGVFDPSWMFVGIENMRPTVMKNLAVKIITVLLIFITISSKNDLWKYSLIMGTTMLISTVVLLFQAAPYVGHPLFRLNNFKKHLLGSLNLFLPQVATLFYLQVDKIMIKLLHNDINQVSFYDQSEKIVTIPLTFITVLSTVMMPRIANEFANKNYERIKDLILSVGKLSLLLACPMMVGIFCIADNFIPWYLGVEFVPTALAIKIICPIIISNAMAGLSGNQYFTATNQINVLMKAYVSAAVANVIVNALLIPKYGFVGAAVATVISSYISVGVQYYYLNKQINVVVFLRDFARYLLFSLMMGVAIHFFNRVVPDGVLETFLDIVFGGVVYLLLLCITKDSMLLDLFSNLKKVLLRTRH